MIQGCVDADFQYYGRYVFAALFPRPRFIFRPRRKDRPQQQTRQKTTRNHRNEHQARTTNIKTDETTATAGPPAPMPKTAHAN